ncbi:hypothetical protein NC653_015613 [Populus alba x Populus x berolinensis]|uniref:Uncharacterized protein n=1 Tax=Populus alba x Populus x berolinensis TaxID=444605 RepID=A0AAD6QL08_9ROSI|nr:hypothetical protein NC653_015613 [Populus alba x Populus x berolinensis]
METTSGLTKDVVRNSDLLGQRHSLSFPYFRDWKFGFWSDLKPKVSSSSSLCWRFDPQTGLLTGTNDGTLKKN